MSTDIENSIFGVNPNWELLTPAGFRFYLPGSIGPGWLDSATTAQVEIHSMLIPNHIEDIQLSENSNTKSKHMKKKAEILHCTAQECPTLLRKGILELFPGCLEVAMPQLTIVTISQNISNRESRWSKELETEKLAQYVSKIMLIKL